MLANLVKKAEDKINSIDFTPELFKYRLSLEYQSYLTANRKNGNEYYKGLAALVREAGAKRVLDLGTFTGASAIALAKYAEHVITCDLTLNFVQDPAIFDSGIEGRELKKVSDCLDLDFSQYEFIFVDIDHTGVMEYRIHEKLKECFNGIAVYDDINLGIGMKLFWEGIENEKVATDWHHSGFGIVKYRREDRVRRGVDQIFGGFKTIFKR